MGLLIEMRKSPASQQSFINSPCRKISEDLDERKSESCWGKSAAGRLQESIFINFVLDNLITIKLLHSNFSFYAEFRLAKQQK